MAIEVTDEMRQAVYEEDCARDGHALNMQTAASWREGRLVVQGPIPEQVAHISCMRCGRVWLVVEEAGRGYADAVAQLKARVKDPAWVQPLPRPTIPTPPAS